METVTESWKKVQHANYESWKLEYLVVQHAKLSNLFLIQQAFDLLGGREAKVNHIIVSDVNWNKNIYHIVLPGKGRSFSFMLVYNACRKHLSKRESTSSVVKFWWPFPSGCCSVVFPSGSSSSCTLSLISSTVSLWTSGSAWLSEISAAASSAETLPSCVPSACSSEESGDWDVETKLGSSTTISS